MDKTKILAIIGKEFSLKEILEVKLDYIVGQVAQSGSLGKNSQPGLYAQVIETVEKSLISLALKHSDTHIEAARMLGINRNTLRKKIKELDIKESGVRSQESE